MNKRTLGCLLGVALAAVLFACGGGGGGGGSDQPSGTVKGVVTNADDGSALAGAQVSLGNRSTQTDAAGSYVLTQVAVADRAVVQINKSGYAENFATVAVTENDTTLQNSQLQSVGALYAANAETETLATMPGSVAMVHIPAHSLVKSDGTAANGNYTVAITPIDPSTNVGTMPGDYVGKSSTGSLDPIESWGVLNVQLTDTSGNKLNLAPGQTATIRIPVATKSANIPGSVPLFYFNESTGNWQEDGTATLAPSKDYYEGQVKHFSVWNSDMWMKTIYIFGCVVEISPDPKPDPKPVPKANVASDGSDYSGIAKAVTDKTGNFKVAIKKDATATILATSADGKTSNTVSVGPSNVDIKLATCLIIIKKAANIKLTWGSAPLDLDGYLIAPDGTTVSYANKGSSVADPFMNLDVDAKNGFGPEVFNLQKLMVGTYTFAVNNYSQTFNPGMYKSPVRVDLARNGSTQTFKPATAGPVGATWWTAFTLSVDASCNVAVSKADIWGTTKPVPTAVTPAQYCTAP